MGKSHNPGEEVHVQAVEGNLRKPQVEGGRASHHTLVLVAEGGNRGPAVGRDRELHLGVVPQDKWGTQVGGNPHTQA